MPDPINPQDQGFNTQDLHEAECELVSDPPPTATGEGSQSVSEGVDGDAINQEVRRWFS